MHGNPEELRAQVDAGDKDGAEQLIRLLTMRGQLQEAHRLRGYGLNPDGSTAGA
jgi:hypothetical protein